MKTHNKNVICELFYLKKILFLYSSLIFSSFSQLIGKNETLDKKSFEIIGGKHYLSSHVLKFTSFFVLNKMNIANRIAFNFN